MDGKNLELIAHNFRNNYECCVNSFGEIWLSDNDDDGNQQTRICYVMPGGNYGYQPARPRPKPLARRAAGHRSQGAAHRLRLADRHLLLRRHAAARRNIAANCCTRDAGPREFRCFHIKPKGAGYELEKELLVTSTDNWFRLSRCVRRPGRQRLLADWYDPGVGGHGMGDWTRGRIYRVTPKGHKGYKVPEVKLETRKAC